MNATTFQRHHGHTHVKGLARLRIEANHASQVVVVPA